MRPYSEPLKALESFAAAPANTASGIMHVCNCLVDARTQFLEVCWRFAGVELEFEPVDAVFELDVFGAERFGVDFFSEPEKSNHLGFTNCCSVTRGPGLGVARATVVGPFFVCFVSIRR